MGEGQRHNGLWAAGHVMPDGMFPRVNLEAATGDQMRHLEMSR